MIIDQSDLRYGLITNTPPQAMPEKKLKNRANDNLYLRTPKGMRLEIKVIIMFLNKFDF